MTPHYLEIVTEDVDAVCAAYEAAHGVSFGPAAPELGGARTAVMAGGGEVGVRGPLRPGEAPVVRPYWRVLDIDAAVAAVAAQGAVIAMAPTDMPGRGRFAIYLQGGVDHGLWEV